MGGDPNDLTNVFETRVVDAASTFEMPAGFSLVNAAHTPDGWELLFVGFRLSDESMALVNQKMAEQSDEGEAVNDLASQLRIVNEEDN